MHSGADRLQSALQLSQEKAQHGPLIRLLRRYRREQMDASSIRASLKPRHQDLDERFLHPQLLPPELLAAPEIWSPEASGLHNEALLAAHPGLTSPEQLVRSGLLNRILRGEIPLYDDLPALAIDAYAAELRQPQRALCRQQLLSALTHLSLHGRDGFRRGEAIAACLDLYRPAADDQNQISLMCSIQQPWLVVIDGQRAEACRLGRSKGWDQVLTAPMDDLGSLFRDIGRLHPDTPVSFCHVSDQLANGSLDQLMHSWHQQAGISLCSSDEWIAWNRADSSRYGNRQCRVKAQVPRLITRGGLGGLITFRAGHLMEIHPPQSVSCMHELVLALTLQLMAGDRNSGHCSQPLLIRSPERNPTVLDVASPAERQLFTSEQVDAIHRIYTQHASLFLQAGGSLEPHPMIPGCQTFRYEPADNPLVSIIIPFRDQAKLTQQCLASIKLHAGSVKYEILLVNNQSSEIETREWLDQLNGTEDIKTLDFDGDFNFARINNLARQSCEGDYLLFLNNDVVFQSPEILKQLMNPFACRSVGAVGSQLRYPDNSIQHNGVVMIRGERRALLEPGKTIDHPAILDRLTPLQVEEEFSAASAACLMIKTHLFDEIGGFNELFAVTFNDVDLCLRLRQLGYSVMITPYPSITHFESKSRGKDLQGSALARQQQEQGLLRKNHGEIYQNGDPLCSQAIHPHSRKYSFQSVHEIPSCPTQEQIVYSWKRNKKQAWRQKTLLFYAQYSSDGFIRNDILPLLSAYQKHADLVVIAATPELEHQKHMLKKLQSKSQALIIRGNEGYDFGSWMTGLRFCNQILENYDQIILSNDSLWGPITPLKQLFNRIDASNADVIGLTDDLMYDYHLQSSFLVFRKTAFTHDAFKNFWSSIRTWNQKRDLIKQHEVGLSRTMINAGMTLESLYTNQSNGNSLHFFWKELITEQEFPFIKVSLLRDNPTSQAIDGWLEIVKSNNPRLAKIIKHQVEQLKHAERNETQ